MIKLESENKLKKKVVEHKIKKRTRIAWFLCVAGLIMVYIGMRYGVVEYKGDTAPPIFYLASIGMWIFIFSFIWLVCVFIKNAFKNKAVHTKK